MLLPTGLSRVCKAQAGRIVDSVYLSPKFLTQQTDIENRNCRNNIRIQGIPESVEAKDLPMAVTAIFKQLLQTHRDEPIELDQVYRTSGLQNSDPSMYVIPSVGSTSLGLKKTSCVPQALKIPYFLMIFLLCFSWIFHVKPWPCDGL